MTVDASKGKLLLCNPDEMQRREALRQAEEHNLSVEIAGSDAEAREKISVCHVCWLRDFGPATQTFVTALRADKQVRHLPMLVVVPDEQLDKPAMELANGLQVELLPTSMPQARRWERLREASEQFRAGKRLHVVNRRAHFRLPLQVKASLICEVETVDISLGGLAFLSRRRYKDGDVGTVDIRSLLGDMDEQQRGFPFEVVSVKAYNRAPYHYLISAKFIELTPEARARLKEALELVEPTSEDQA